MTHGTIKTIREDRGFGFITPDNGNGDLFFHHTAVEEPTFEELREGQRVQFEPGQDSRDPSRQRATHVRLADPQ
jgi:CspA family cold shock protein